MFYKIIVLKRLKNLEEDTLTGVFLSINLQARDTPTLVLSGEFYEIFNNTYLVEHLRTTFLLQRLLTRKF